MALKICTIGCGNHATKVHGPSYKKYRENFSDTRLVACCDLDEEKAAAFRDAFGFEKYYTDLDRMLEVEKPDAVCLVAPVDLTFELASLILEKGFPLMMEKPQAKTYEEAYRLMEIAREKKVPNQVAYNRRFDPLISELKKILDKNFKPGDIHDIRCDMYRVKRFDPEFATTAVHGIDAVRFLAGSDFSRINFHYQELPDIGRPGVMNYFLDCEFESGAYAHFNICPVAGVRIERITVNLYDNTLFCNTPMWFEYDVPGSLVHLQNNIEVLNIKGSDLVSGTEIFETCGFYQENVSFFEDIRAGRMPEVNLETTLQTVEIEECMIKKVPVYIKK